MTIPNGPNHKFVKSFNKSQNSLWICELLKTLTMEFLFFTLIHPPMFKYGMINMNITLKSIYMKLSLLVYNKENDYLSISDSNLILKFLS